MPTYRVYVYVYADASLSTIPINNQRPGTAIARIDRKHGSDKLEPEQTQTASFVRTMRVPTLHTTEQCLLWFTSLLIRVKHDLRHLPLAFFKLCLSSSWPYSRSRTTIVLDIWKP